MRDDILLDCARITKNFPGVKALRGVDFTLRRGEVHGLVGENGAGKSTLAKIIAGFYRADEGEIRLNGESLKLKGPDDALRHRIVTVHQDINLIPTLSVADNIRLNNEITFGRSGLINGRRTYAQVSDLLRRYDLNLSPQTLVSELTYDQRKMVQIMKAVSRKIEVLLLDEPTAALTDSEVELVLKLIRSLAGDGIGIVFISHYLNEIFAVCDKITVLRDGSKIVEFDRRSASPAEAVRAMLGRDLAEDVGRPPVIAAGAAVAPVLEVRNLNVRGKLRDISFTLNRGEILGITGLSGSGASDLAKAVFGARDVIRQSGEFLLDGFPTTLRTPRDCLRNGLTFLTNDRLREGILSDFSIVDNVCLPGLGKYSKGISPLLDTRAMRESGERVIRQMRVRAPSATTLMKNLSGGNQQKVLVGKWLATKPRVLIMDEPTIGIDVGSKQEIRRIISAIAAEGVGIILITTELEELTKLCHRVLVLFRGRIVQTFDGPSIQRQSILRRSAVGGE